MQYDDTEYHHIAKYRNALADVSVDTAQLIFAPNSPELASALQFTMQAGLNRWLGDLIELRSLDVQSNEAELRINVNYVVRRTNETRTAQLARRI